MTAVTLVRAVGMTHVESYGKLARKKGSKIER